MSRYEDLALDPADRICGNCAHWDYANAHFMVVNTDYGRREYRVAPCRQEAVEADAGQDALVLLNAKSHCRMHADAFEPDLSYLEDIATPAEVQNGVSPGVDFPASLTKVPALS